MEALSVQKYFIMRTKSTN